MITPRVSIFGVYYSPTDYDEASEVIIRYATSRRSLGVSALAVHGLVTAVRDSHFRECVNTIQLVVPDGQPIRWTMNRYYGCCLSDRVYGPFLTRRVLEEANRIRLSVFLFGSKEETLQKLASYIGREFPGVRLVGVHPDRFREATPEEDASDIARINSSGANLVLVGRGCPRQEIWVANHIGKVNAPMMAVGAAFDFFAGTKPMAPKWMQDCGLEWLFRLLSEPRRLAGRYLTTNTHFLYLSVMAAIRGYPTHDTRIEEL